MKRSQLLLVGVVALALGLGGWLAKSWLRVDPPALPDRDGGTAAETARGPRGVAPAAVERSSEEPPEAERSEEISPAIPPPSESAGAPGSIVGRVLNPQGEPVSSAEVELMTGPAMGLQIRHLNHPTGLVVATDGEGRYRFASVEPSDDYIVVASHGDYGDCEAGPVVVPPGQEVRVADVRLRVGILIHGVVTSNGRPVHGATLTLSNAMEKIRRFQPAMFKDRLKELNLEPIEVKSVTDADGRYEFAAIPFDTFELTAEADGLARMIRTSQGNFLGGSAREHEINFDLGPASTITGRVVDEARNGIPGAKVTATLTNPSVRCEATAMTDAGGRFVLDHLAQGQFFLGADCDGFSSSHRAQVLAGSSDVEIEMRLQGAVSGVVVDEETGDPITGFELAVLQGHKGRGPAVARDNLSFRDSGGRFEIRNLDPGRYLIQATVVDYADSTSAEFEVARGQATTGVRVPVHRGGSIAGIVVDRDGNPVQRALVKVRDNGTRENPVFGILGGLALGARRDNQIRTAEDGSFRIDLIVPDTYQVFVKCNGFAPLPIDDVEIAKGQVLQLGRIELAKGGRLRGRSYDLEGRPLPGATIVATTKSGDTYTTRSQNDGAWELLALPAGEYTVTINSYPSNPPVNALQAIVYAKNSRRECRVMEGDDLSIDLRLRER